MNLIVAAAGKSTRYPGLRPKWMLVHPNGNLMLTESIKGLNLHDIENIYLGVLKEHLNEYKCQKGIEDQLDKIGISNKTELIVLDEPTRNQPETVKEMIELGDIKGSIYIKDADNFFNYNISSSNEISVFSLNKMKNVNPSNKSYVIVNENENVENIVEKQVISSMFCCGGYSFESADLFVKSFNKLSDEDGLYISHIIFNMILNGAVFHAKEVNNYLDWGTLDDWSRFRDTYSTIFVDLDGTLVKSSSEFFEPYWGETAGIKDNIDVINKLYDSGRTQIIITTSRKESYRDVTIKQLKKNGVKYHKILFDILHSKRLIINDYAKSNSYKSCDAINIKRNSSNLKELLGDSVNINDN